MTTQINQASNKNFLCHQGQKLETFWKNHKVTIILIGAGIATIGTFSALAFIGGGVGILALMPLPLKTEIIMIAASTTLVAAGIYENYRSQQIRIAAEKTITEIHPSPIMILGNKLSHCFTRGRIITGISLMALGTLTFLYYRNGFFSSFCAPVVTALTSKSTVIPQLPLENPLVTSYSPSGEIASVIAAANQSNEEVIPPTNVFNDLFSQASILPMSICPASNIFSHRLPQSISYASTSNASVCIAPSISPKFGNYSPNYLSKWFSHAYHFFSLLKLYQQPISSTKLKFSVMVLSLVVNAEICMAARVAATALIPRSRMQTAWRNRFERDPPKDGTRIYDFSPIFSDPPEGWIPPWWGKKKIPFLKLKF